MCIRDSRYGEWRQMERKWSEHLQDGKDVEVEIIVAYEDKNDTPKLLQAFTSVNGSPSQPKIFPN